VHRQSTAPSRFCIGHLLFQWDLFVLLREVRTHCRASETRPVVPKSKRNGRNPADSAGTHANTPSVHPLDWRLDLRCLLR
jgi:hypothetical protein